MIPRIICDLCSCWEKCYGRATSWFWAPRLLVFWLLLLLMSHPSRPWWTLLINCCNVIYTFREGFKEITPVNGESLISAFSFKASFLDVWSSPDTSMPGTEKRKNSSTHCTKQLFNPGSWQIFQAKTNMKRRIWCLGGMWALGISAIEHSAPFAIEGEQKIGLLTALFSLERCLDEQG